METFIANYVDAVEPVRIELGYPEEGYRIIRANGVKLTGVRTPREAAIYVLDVWRNELDKIYWNPQFLEENCIPFDGKNIIGFQEIVINIAYGGFDLSPAAIRRLNELGLNCRVASDVARHDPMLVRVVKELGQLAAGQFCELAICEVPSDVSWEIEDSEGAEWVSEIHRRWRGEKA